MKNKPVDVLTKTLSIAPFVFLRGKFNVQLLPLSFMRDVDVHVGNDPIV